MFQAISSAEKEFIRAGCDVNVRFDGRGPKDFRHISMENNILPHVNGSSRLRVADSVDIICSVKVEVSEPSNAFPDNGLFDLGIEFSPSCNLKLDDRKLLEYGSQIAQQLQSFIVNSNTFNMKELCIISGKFCWNICVDLLVLQMDGDPLDACSIATYVALNCTKIPKVEIFLGESGMPEDFEVNGDLGESTLLKAKGLPICVSSCKTLLSHAMKIGKSLVLDATGTEQACSSSIFSVAVNDTGACCGFNTSLGGHFEALDIATAVLNASTSSAPIFSWMHDCYSLSTGPNKNDCLYPDMPPVRAGLLA